MCKKYGVGRGKAAAQRILTQLAKSELLPLLLAAMLPLKPLLLLTSQMATLGLGQGVSGLGLGVSGKGPGVSGHGLGVSGQGLTSQLLGLTWA